MASSALPTSSQSPTNLHTVYSLSGISSNQLLYNNLNRMGSTTNISGARCVPNSEPNTADKMVPESVFILTFMKFILRLERWT